MLRIMDIQESNNITVSDIDIKVEKFDDSSVNKPSSPNISIESQIDENYSLNEYSFVKPETVAFKTEEDGTFYELTKSKLNGKKIVDEHFDELKYVISEEIYIKNEVQEEDQINIKTNNERKIKDESFDVPEFISHEDIVIKTEDQERDQSNTKYFDPDCEESRKTFTCRYCHAGLSVEKYKNVHERRCKFRKKEQHLGGSTFECPYCKLLYTREEDKNKHQAVCKKRKETENCERSTTKKVERKYRCDICIYETQWKRSLVRHIQIHDKVNALKYSCTQCAYEAIDKSALKKHLRRHDCFGMICILCQKSFKHKHNLDAHCVSKHSDRSDKWESMITNKINECPKCLYKTVRKGDFKNHLATHGTQKDQAQFKCNICGYQCICKTNYKTHLRLHVGQLPFVCTECDKRFNTKQQLDRHIIARHSENEDLTSRVTSKVYRCEKCDFKTVHKTHFKKHVKKCL